MFTENRPGNFSARQGPFLELNFTARPERAGLTGGPALADLWTEVTNALTSLTSCMHWYV